MSTSLISSRDANDALRLCSETCMDMYADVRRHVRREYRDVVPKCDALSWFDGGKPCDGLVRQIKRDEAIDRCKLLGHCR